MTNEPIVLQSVCLLSACALMLSAKNFDPVHDFESPQQYGHIKLVDASGVQHIGRFMIEVSALQSVEHAAFYYEFSCPRKLQHHHAPQPCLT